MTAAQHGPVDPAEIGELLATDWVLPSEASLAEQAAFFEWKSDLLSRIAVAFDTAEARAPAAEACAQADAIAVKVRAVSEAQP